MTDPQPTRPDTRIDADGQEHVRPTQTRGASKENVGRWVLIGSMLLIIVAMTIVWVTGALSS